MAEFGCECTNLRIRRKVHIGCYWKYTFGSIFCICLFICSPCWSRPRALWSLPPWSRCTFSSCLDFISPPACFCPSCWSLDCYWPRFRPDWGAWNGSSPLRRYSWSYWCICSWRIGACIRSTICCLALGWGWECFGWESANRDQDPSSRTTWNRMVRALFSSFDKINSYNLIFQCGRVFQTGAL